jgi:hypothetical protein
MRQFSGKVIREIGRVMHSRKLLEVEQVLDFGKRGGRVNVLCKDDIELAIVLLQDGFTVDLAAKTDATELADVKAQASKPDPVASSAQPPLPVLSKGTGAKLAGDTR